MITIPITYTGLTPSMAEAVEIVSGQRDTISVQFSFSDDWSAYKLRTAMFSSRTATRAQMIEEDGTAVIPSEVIRNGERYVKISAFGTLERADGEIERYNGRAITLRIDIGGDVEESGGCTDATAYEKLLVRVTALEERVDNLPAGGGGGGGSSVVLDTTLTKKGYAADAKAVGDALAKKVGEKELDTAVETALAEAKKSGEFDGPPGQPGEPGTTPHIGANGNWWTGTTDTGVKAKGDDYVLTEADKTAIAGETAGMVDVPEKLPNPNALTFSGAVSGTYDGSEPLNVVIPSGGGGTGGTSVELDSTLTQPGKAADAKAVGDAIAGQNDAIEKKLDADELPAAVETALAEAKESGEFDGPPGQPGTTPHIGANGNWWIGTTDTGVKAQGNPGDPGQPGTTPHIGGNGNWWIGTTDTGVKAQGEPGQPGAPGDDYVLTDGDIDEIASAAAGKINISGKADISSVPNSAAVNADNELVMQRADGDAISELFKVALPAGGSAKWVRKYRLETTEEVSTIYANVNDIVEELMKAVKFAIVFWANAVSDSSIGESPSGAFTWKTGGVVRNWITNGDFVPTSGKTGRLILVCDGINITDDGTKVELYSFLCKTVGKTTTEKTGQNFIFGYMPGASIQQFVITANNSAFGVGSAFEIYIAS